jgi:hypothetical protein
MSMAYTEAERVMRAPRGGAVAAGDHQVEVVVGSSLLAEQGIDAPASVNPHLDAAGGASVEDLRHIVASDHASAPSVGLGS